MYKIERNETVQGTTEPKDLLSGFCFFVFWTRMPLISSKKEYCLMIQLVMDASPVADGLAPEVFL